MVDIMAGGTNKYAKAAKRGAKIIELVCLKDGAVMKFIDEGPHPQKPDGGIDPSWQKRSPTPSRQKLVSAILKRDANDLPIFFSMTKGVKVWDASYDRFIEVPVINDEIRAAQAQYLAIRDANVAQGNVLAKGERAKNKAQAAAGAA
jgi:hypothetical protein